VYVRGLMLDGKRKSIEPMAARLPDGDEQCLQQFVNQSPWDPVAVRRALARRMSREIAPEAWVIDDTGFPKFGKHSVGVARQYSGALGKVGNCQIGVSVNAACDAASCPLDWRLFIPEEWDDPGEFNHDRRAKAKLPEDAHHMQKWRLAVEMIDELIGWGLEPAVILGDGAYGDVTEFRSGLQEREIGYVLDVKSTTSAYRENVAPAQPPRPEGRGRPPGARYRDEPSSLKELALAAGQQAAVTVTWREGSRGEMTSRFIALRIRPANIHLRRAAHKTGAQLPVSWLICEWPDDTDTPSKYWLSNLPADTDLTTLVRLAKMRWRIEHDYRELKDALGLDHFEGRSWQGLRRHALMTMIAFAFLQHRRLKKAKREKKNQWTAASTKLAGRPSRHRHAHRSTAAAAMPALPKMDLRKHAA